MNLFYKRYYDKKLAKLFKKNCMKQHGITLRIQNSPMQHTGSSGNFQLHIQKFFFQKRELE